MTDESAELSDERHKDSDPKNDFRSSFSSASKSDNNSKSSSSSESSARFSSSNSDNIIQKKSEPLKIGTNRFLSQTDFDSDIIKQGKLKREGGTVAADST